MLPSYQKLTSIKDYEKIKNYYSIDGKNSSSPLATERKFLGSHRPAVTDHEDISRKDIQRQFLFACSLDLTTKLMGIANQAHIRFKHVPLKDPRFRYILCPGNEPEKRWAVMSISPFKDAFPRGVKKTIRTNKKNVNETIEKIYHKIINTTAEYFSRPNQINRFLMAYFGCGEGVKGILGPKFPFQCREAIRVWEKNPRKFTDHVNLFFRKSSIVRNLISENLAKNYFSNIKGSTFTAVMGAEQLSLVVPSQWENLGRMTLRLHEDRDSKPSNFYRDKTVNEPAYYIQLTPQRQRELDVIRGEMEGALFETFLSKQVLVYDFICEIATRTLLDIREMIQSATVPESVLDAADERRFITFPPESPEGEKTVLSKEIIRNWLNTHSRIIQVENEKDTQFLKKITSSAFNTFCHHIADNHDYKTVLTLLTCDSSNSIGRSSVRQRDKTFQLLMNNPQNFSVHVIEKLLTSKMIFRLVNSIVEKNYADQISTGKITSEFGNKMPFYLSENKLQLGLGHLKLTYPL